MNAKKPAVLDDETASEVRRLYAPIKVKLRAPSYLTCTSVSGWMISTRVVMFAG